MDTAMDSSNLLLLASLSSYVSIAADGISITGNVVDSLMVHVETVEIGEVGAAIDPSSVPSSVADASVVEREVDVPLEEVADGGATRGSATDPLLPPGGVAGGTEENTITEPPIPTSDIDPLKSRKNTGMASIVHVLVISKDLCWACLMKKTSFPLLSFLFFFFFFLFLQKKKAKK